MDSSINDLMRITPYRKIVAQQSIDHLQHTIEKADAYEVITQDLACRVGALLAQKKSLITKTDTEDLSCLTLTCYVFSEQEMAVIQSYLTKKELL